MKHFKEIKDLNSLRNKYRELCKIYHPDISGFDSTAIMQEINNEYDVLTEKFAKGMKYEETEKQFSDALKIKIVKFIKIPNINIEIIGNWIWITGETKPIKEILKAEGFFFAGGKKAWYYKTYKYRKHNKENISFNDLRAKFGNINVAKEENLTLQF